MAHTSVRPFFVLGLAVGLFAGSPAEAASPTLELAIQEPTPELLLTGQEESIEVRGVASIHGGVRQIDLLLVMDVSSSLKNTDPDDYRKAGAIGLVESLPEWSDIQVGVVSFGRKAKLLAPLAVDRTAAIDALMALERGSTTNLAAGLETAIQGFADQGRAGSNRVVLVFSDGRSNGKRARRAMEKAQSQGIVIHTLLLGRDDEGEAMLRGLSGDTGGSFVQVMDPAGLPEAFMNLRTAGIENVTLQVNEGEPITAALTLGTFAAEVPLETGENRIVATVRSRDGQTDRRVTTVTVRPPGCAELVVKAVRDGQPAISLSHRRVELVVDASRSMWGQLEGEAKMSIAKRTLDDALDWLPQDIELALRAYGHRHTPAQRDCRDTELLVGASPGNRSQIRDAVAALKPRGQTPLAYALQQVAADFQGFAGERAVVLVTDGIESCDGDAAQVARDLQRDGQLPVHVIGFGMADAGDEDLSSLRAIADSSGGHFLMASNARELQDALMTTVGTPFHVMRGGQPVGRGILGAKDVVRLPAGSYTIRLDSTPPRQAAVTLASEIRETVIFDGSASAEDGSQSWRDAAEYATCGSDALAGSPGGPPPSPSGATAGATSGATTGSADVPMTPPASPAAAAPKSGADSSGPNARRTQRFDVEGGSVEVWRNMRPQRSADWGVVARHPSLGERPVLLYQGNDEDAAVDTARAARDKLQRGEPVR